MSDPLRVALVVEGPTDYVVLRAAMEAILGDRDFEATVLRPELSKGLETITGGGWTAVYLWCRLAVKQAKGAVRDHPLFGTHDVLIVQVDADVAGKRYADDSRIQAPPNDLPCEQPCPPATATTDALRSVILGWLDEEVLPPRTVLCTPSKSIDTWVLLALFPNDGATTTSELECRRNIDAQLQSKPLSRRLIRGGQKQINKYRESEGELRNAWANVRVKCGEAERFSRDFLAALPGTDAI